MSEAYRVKVLSISDLNNTYVKQVGFETTIQGKRVTLSCKSTKEALRAAMRAEILAHIKMEKEKSDFAPKNEFTV